jgi:secreted trypsin-like serine protease
MARKCGRRSHLCWWLSKGNIDSTSNCCQNLDVINEQFQGDSGGPLQVRGEDGRWYLVGITSFGDDSTDETILDQGNNPGYLLFYNKNSFFQQIMLCTSIQCNKLKYRTLPRNNLIWGQRWAPFSACPTYCKVAALHILHWNMFWKSVP